MEQEQIEKFSDLLHERLHQLNKDVQSNADARAPVTLDQQSVGRVSRIDAMQQQAMAKAQERQRAIQIVHVERALERIKSGDYGYCLECGDPIATKRLEIDPATPLCIRCAGKT